MVRPREFNEDAVLDAAMKAFWRHGYAATPLIELLEATGLSKSSLYDCFGCKHELLLAVLDRNIEAEARKLDAVLDGAESPKAGIHAAFDHVLARIAADDPERGCFIGNCANELGPHDPDVAKRVRASLTRTADQFAQAVRRAQAAGEIPADRDPEALGRYLIACEQGLHVMAKADRDPEGLRETVEVMLRALD